MTGKTSRFSISKRGISILVMLAIILTTAGSLKFITSTRAESETMTFTNVTNDGGMDKISMSNERVFEVTVSLPAGADPDEYIAQGLSWKLSREQGLFNTAEFPHQVLGGPLEDWMQYGDAPQSLFYNLNEEAIEINGKPAIRFTFQNRLLFKSTQYGEMPYVNRNRNQMLDYVGDFTLSCADADGNVLGDTTVRMNPYDSYRTNEEFSEELVEAASYANGRNDMYATILSLGESSGGRNMPYIIIAKNEAVLSNYQALKERAESDPAGLIADIESGAVADYQVPVLYSNVHADETNGADAPMNFIWDLVLSDQSENKITYNILTDLTSEGEERIELERSRAGVQTSKLLKDWPTYLGAATENESGFNSGTVDLDRYYDSDELTLDVSALLDNVFFIIVPEENVDGRTYNTRNNNEGFDLNRDNLFQIQKETQNMTAMIANWNPITFFEFHGFVSGFQIEPCSPPHEPNVEYDLFAEMAFKAGENFGAAAVANNNMYNSYVMPLRDYLVTQDDKPYWKSPWDDMSTNYTPQYSMLHGTIAYTVEIPSSNEDGTKAMEYGMISHAQFVLDNKEQLFLNQLNVYKRGIENEDAESVRPWYVDANDNIGAEADIFRPRYEENDNFFPEYYVIPLDGENQRNLASAYEMEEYFLRNGVKVSRLTADTTVNNVTYKAGSIVIDMHQAKRNAANAVLYQGVLITGWPTLYSEPITAFDKTRGFDCDAIRTEGAFEGKLTNVETAQSGSTEYNGSAGNAVIIKNSGVEAIRAINALLDAGKKVGYITEGDYKSDFAVSYSDFQTIKDQFVLNTYGVDTSPAAKEIKKPKVYVQGRLAQASTGYIEYNNVYNSALNYNFNRFSFENIMNFDVTRNIDEADVIVANAAFSVSSEEAAVIAAVESGTPIVLYGQVGLVSSFVPDVTTNVTPTENNNRMDWLATVEYLEDENPVTDSYRLSGDDIMYGYGGNYFTSLPDDATPLIRVSKNDPLEGFFAKDRLEAFKGQIIAFEYIQGGKDVTVFANTLTNKGHQQDDFRYVTNVVYTKMLGEDYEIPVTTTPNPEEVDKSELAELVAKAEAIEQDLYTEETVEVLLTALSNGKLVMTDDNATQVTVDNASSLLRNALDSLKLKDAGSSDNKTGNGTSSPKTGDALPFILLAVVLVAGGSVLALKKKNSK